MPITVNGHSLPSTNADLVDGMLTAAASVVAKGLIKHLK